MSTYLLKPGNTLTLVSDALTVGSYRVIDDPDNTGTAPTTVAVSTTVVLGPFTSLRRYEVLSNGGEIAATQAFMDLTSLPSSTSIGAVSSAELQDLDGVTSAIQTQMDLKAPKASPTFTGTVVLPSTTSISTLTGTELGYLHGVTSAVQTQMDLKAPLASPTFTGTVVLPSTTSISTLTGTELSYLHGVTSALQTQIDLKAPAASPAFTGSVTGLITDHGLGTEASNAVTINATAGTITTSSLTVAAQGSYIITLTNNKIVGTGSVIIASIAGGTNTTKNISLESICTAASTATLTIYNDVLVTTALNGTVKINFMVV